MPDHCRGKIAWISQMSIDDQFQLAYHLIVIGGKQQKRNGVTIADY
jgi:hypothetical protein